MTSVTLLARLRSVLDEATAGFYTDAELYGFLEMGQNECIQILLGKQREKRKVEPDYSHPSLVNSILTTYTYSITDTTNYKALPSGFLQMEYVQMYHLVDGAVVRTLLMTPVPYHELMKRANNTYSRHTYASYTGQVYYAIVGANLQTSFDLFPNGDYNRLLIWYYAQPTAIASGQNPTLKEETHEAIMNMACSYAQSKNNDLERAKFHLVKAQNILNSL